MQITKFLGLRLSLTGDTNLTPGELSSMKNIRITSDYKARKREGYIELFDALNNPIRGQWKGYIGGVFYHLFACGGHLYKTIAGVNTDLGSIADSPTSFFFFDTKLYIQDGTEYRSFDGTTLEVAVGHAPLIAISTPPTGGGTDYEGINLLNGSKRQSFRSDGTHTEYTLREQNLDSIDFVKLYGVTKTLGVDYSQNLVTGKITFTLQPPNWTGDEDDVEIKWTKGTGSRTEVTAHKYFSLFGGKNDTRVFLYGDKNTMIFTGLADGVPSAEYFPALNYADVGSSQFPITYIAKQYDRQIIFTTQGAYYSVYEYDVDLGANFPIYPLNDKIGSIVQGQVIENNPFTVQSGVWQWLATNVRDERNAQKISEKIQPALDNLDLSTAITFDYEELREFWLCIGNKIHIYNYGNDTWYYFETAHTPTSLITIDGVLYMGTSNGQIMKWAQYIEQDTIPEYLTDNGTTIQSFMTTGFLDDGINYKRKFLNFGWVGMKPESKSICFVEWQSDYDASTEPEIISYSLIDFDNIDFANFSFEVNYNPQPFRIKLKCKKFVYVEFTLSNNSDTETMTVLSLNLPMVVGGVAK